MCAQRLSTTAIVVICVLLGGCCSCDDYDDGELPVNAHDLYHHEGDFVEVPADVGGSVAAWAAAPVGLCAGALLKTLSLAFGNSAGEDEVFCATVCNVVLWAYHVTGVLSGGPFYVAKNGPPALCERYVEEGLFVKAPTVVGEVAGGLAGFAVAFSGGGLLAIPISFANSDAAGVIFLSAVIYGTEWAATYSGAITGTPFYVMKKAFWDCPRALFADRGPEATTATDTPQPEEKPK